MGTAETLSSRGELFAAGFGFGEVHLVEGHDLTAAGRLRRVGRQLGLDDLEVVLRVGPGGSDDVNEQAGALDVAQELEAEAGAFVAPSMRPGMSAMTRVVSQLDDTEVGTSVVNG